MLVLTLARALVTPVADNPAATRYLGSDASTPVKDGMIATWLTESLFLAVVAAYVAVILAITARRSRVARETLTVGTGAGLVLGAVMYAIFPIGLTKQATDPWLPALPVNLLVALAWILLFGGPMLAATVAARRYRGGAGVRQGAAAGFLATGVGALTVAALGTATVALMPRAGWVLQWLYPGQHMTAADAYIRELTASVRIGHYGLVLLFFPVIGLLTGLWAQPPGAAAASAPGRAR